MKDLTVEQSLILDFVRGEFRSDKIDMQRLSLATIDWNELFDLSTEHKIFPLLFRLVRQFLPNEYQEKYLSAYKLHLVSTLAQISELKKIANAIRCEKIPTVLVKGVSLSHIIYDDLLVRPAGDIDILVKERDMSKVNQIMLELGYSFESEDLNQQFKESGELIYRGSYDHHEHNYVKKLNSLISVHVEIKRATSSVKKTNINAFMRNTIRIPIELPSSIPIEKFSVNTFNINYTFLHLCVNAYHNSEEALFDEKRIRLRDYVDLHCFLSKYEKNICWNEIYSLSIEFEMQHKLFYILNSLNLIYGNFVEVGIVELFKPLKVKYKYNGYNSGALVDWNSSIIERFFYDKKNVKMEFYSLFRKRTYSSLNRNYFTCLNVNKYNSQEVLKKGNYLKYIDMKYAKHAVSYMFSYDDENLIILSKIPTNFKNVMENHQIVFKFYDNGSYPSITERVVAVTKEGEQFIYIFENMNICKDSFEIVTHKVITEFIEEENSILLKISIPFSDLAIDLSKTDNKICFNMGINERVFENQFYSIGRKYPVEHPGVIQLSQIN